MEKDKGAIEYTTSVMLVAVTVLLLLFCFRVRSAGVEKLYIEDALATANLAAAVIDTEVYGEREELIITDYEKSLKRFQKSLRLNLNLDENYRPYGTFLMENPVRILEFHIYNMEPDRIVHVVFDEHGGKSMEILGTSGVMTPNGKTVESTTIYSKIEFDVKGFLSQRSRQTLDNSVDVVKN